MSSPARLAIGQACSEQTLKDVGDNTAAGNSLGLPINTTISSTYVKAVTASGNANGTTGTVIVTMNAIGTSVIQDSTIIYTATCGAAGTTWAVTGSANFPTKYLPKT
jgi:type IV pilus assembly protein PilA